VRHRTVHFVEILILVAAALYIIGYNVEYEVQEALAPHVVDMNDVNDITLEADEIQWQIGAEQSMKEQILHMVREK